MDVEPSDDRQPREQLYEFCPRCSAPNPKPPFCERCKFDLRYGATSRAKIGVCAYCKTDGELTDQHIIGDWARIAYPSKEKREHRLSRPKHVRFFSQLSDRDLVIEPQNSSEGYGETVRNVCENCNNTWMYIAEKQAIPIVRSFAEGGCPTLTSDQEKILARWAAMRVVSLEHKARVITIPQDHRDQLMRGDMPGGWLVYVALMSSTQAAGQSRHNAMVLPVGLGNDFVKGQLSYFIVERMVILTFSTFGSRTMELWEQIDTPYPANAARIMGLTPVWPTENSYPSAKLSTSTKKFNLSDFDSLFANC
jgi:hypothetical protein